MTTISNFDKGDTVSFENVPGGETIVGTIDAVLTKITPEGAVPTAMVKSETGAVYSCPLANLKIWYTPDD